MELKPLKFSCLVATLMISGCYNPIQANKREAIYLEKLDEFEKTKNIQAICDAADIIGNRQKSFPMSKAKRSQKFVEHKLTGLREAETKGDYLLQQKCASGLYEALWLGRPKRLTVSPEMTDCLRDKMVNNVFTADDYLTCAAKYNYVP